LYPAHANVPPGTTSCIRLAHTFRIWYHASYVCFGMSNIEAGVRQFEYCLSNRCLIFGREVIEPLTGILWGYRIPDAMQVTTAMARS
jgi:hypothetical protein